MKHSAMEQSSLYDVAVVGGGPAGLTLGVTLARFMPELKVLVIDKKGFEVPNDARSLALAAGVTRIFEALGIWEKMSRHASPISHMRVTDSGSDDISRPLFLSFDGEVFPGRPFAHMVPIRDIAGVLLEAAKEEVEFKAGVQVRAMHLNGPLAELLLDNNSSVRTKLVVAADGSRSAVRDMAGIRTTGHDYRQNGLVTTIFHEIDHKNTAFEHFRPAGPFASLPLPGSRSSLVWTEGRQEAERLLTLTRQEQANIIEASMGHTLGKVELEEPVQSFPLRLCLAREFVAPRLALLGDAAHAIHPITGQGLNLGLKDVAALSEVIVEAVRLGQDHGDVNVLRGYERWRRLDVALMAMVTDSLNRLFSNEVLALRIARDFGLGLVDRMPDVKKFLIRHAAGQSPGSPKLLMGRVL
ncbi:MAG TPA: 2-octaprenyl-6-methoxyphenyl hydroxylase [Devosia sp.]|nr:2-octaprenyl-6-methoxyphenyl hydroxylase [Devosia sp.]